VSDRAAVVAWTRLFAGGDDFRAGDGPPALGKCGIGRKIFRFDCVCTGAREAMRNFAVEPGSGKGVAWEEKRS
jgi:hypothetical protein